MAVRSDSQDSDHRAAQEVAPRTEINSRPEPDTRTKLFRRRTRGRVRKIGSAEEVSSGSRTLACAPKRSVAPGVLRRFEPAGSRECNGRFDRQCPPALRTGEQATRSVR